MPYITGNMSDGELNTALQNFNEVCIENAAGLGLTVPQLGEIAAAASGFNDAYNAWTAAKALAESKREAKDSQRAFSRNVVSRWGKTFRANPLVPNALLEQMMLAPHETPGVKTNPTIPQDLVANSDGLGNIKLQWKRNGNIQGTSFVIESRTSVSDPWNYLATISKSSFEMAWPVGTYIAFRVKAVRRGISSSFGTPVVLWEDESGSELTLAA